MTFDWATLFPEVYINFRAVSSRALTPKMALDITSPLCAILGKNVAPVESNKFDDGSCYHFGHDKWT